MAFDQKIVRIAALLEQHLHQRLTSAAYPTPVATKLDANKDLYLEVNVTGGATPDAVIRLKTWFVPANENINPVTGLAQNMFNPHYVEVGFDAGVQATDTVTLTAALATKTVTINGSVFTAVAGAAANATQFTVAGDDTADAAALANAINTSVDPLIVGVVSATSDANVVTITAVAAGVKGNSITVASNDASMVVATATLTGGTSTSSPTTDALKVYVLCDAAFAGPAMYVYEKAAIVVTDLGNAAYLKAVYSSIGWGQMDRQ